MAKFRKRPVVVEAIRTEDAIKLAARNWNGLPEWLRESYDKGGVVFATNGITIPTLEGIMLAQFDDWIIRGVNGELYPCKPNIFTATYEPVGEDSL